MDCTADKDPAPVNMIAIPSGRRSSIRWSVAGTWGPPWIFTGTKLPDSGIGGRSDRRCPGIKTLWESPRLLDLRSFISANRTRAGL